MTQGKVIGTRGLAYDITERNSPNRKQYHQGRIDATGDAIGMSILKGAISTRTRLLSACSGTP